MRLRKILLFPFKLVFISVLLVVFIPFVLWCFIEEIFIRKRRTLRFCRENCGKIFLICSRRRGWYEFLENNLIPAIPENIEPVWIESKYKDRKVKPLFVAMNRFYSPASKPFLLKVESNTLRRKSLNGILQNYKSKGKKDSSIHRDLNKIVEEQVAAF